MEKYWGYHLILDCSHCENISDYNIIKSFVDELLTAIDMIPHGEIQLEYLLEGSDNEGYSLLQMITTSNITAHFVTKQKSAYIDIFSCKHFDKDIVVSVIENYFKPSSIQETFLKRSA